MEIIRKIKSLIAGSEIGTALQTLETFLDDDEALQNEVILLQARLHLLSDNKDKNLLSNSEYNIELNQINQSTLHLLNKIFIFNQKVSHSDFLTDLLLKLEGVYSPIPNDIPQIIKKVGTNVTDKELLEVLLNVLPYPLGIRLRQIASDSWDKRQAEKYYSELLYDYVVFFETLLHHTCFLLLSHLWQNISEYSDLEKEQQKKSPDFIIAHEYLTTNHIAMPLAKFRPVIHALLQVSKQNDNEKGIPKLIDSAEKCLTYIDSEAFIEAAAFFDLRKKAYWEEQKIFMTEDSILDYCERSKKYILESFSHFSFIINNALFVVQGVDVVNFRHTEKEVKFNNIFSILLESHQGKKSATVEKSSLPMENKSILCFDNTEMSGHSLNLFPFLINRNAFSKKSSENDVYQFIGYFKDKWMDERSKRVVDYPCFYFISVRKPKNIWRFDMLRFYNNDLTHIDEILGLNDNEMYNTKELKEYLNSFLDTLI